MSNFFILFINLEKMLEVEVKAYIKDIEKFMEKLKNIKAKFLKEEKQIDVYFNSPTRNFAETDEALRVRQIIGIASRIPAGLQTFTDEDKFYLTYKGKKIDKETKTREEIETSCDEKIFDVLEKLNFKKVASVEKRRKYYKYKNFEICVDNVKGLGNFVEIESHDLNNKEEIFNLLEIFDIKREETIRKSYLELLKNKS